MTCCNVILDEHQATIVTDTRSHHPLGFDIDTPKTMPIPHMQLAVVTRGPAAALMQVAVAICAGAFDYDSVRTFVAREFATLGLTPETEIIVAGIGSKGPAAFAISAKGTGGKVVDVLEHLVCPAVSAEHYEEFAADPVGSMPLLMSRQAGISPVLGGSMIVTHISGREMVSYQAGQIDPAVKVPAACFRNAHGKLKPSNIKRN